MINAGRLLLIDFSVYCNGIFDCSGASKYKSPYQRSSTQGM